MYAVRVAIAKQLTGVTLIVRKSLMTTSLIWKAKDTFVVSHCSNSLAACRKAGCFFFIMNWEIKILEWAIGFFSAIKKNAENAVQELKFMKYELQFDERDDDIYVATFLKSGTTWMQMILYQLTTDGEINFNHIYDVSPWLRNLSSKGGKLPELPSPRIIKTHDPYSKINKYKKGRYIFIIRDGLDVANSLYHHRKNYVNGKITYDENFEMTYRTKGVMNWFDFNKQWLENKKNLPILYVRYEDLQMNFEHELSRIAKFLSIELKQENISRIRERCSFNFMKAHEEKFGEQPPKEKHEIIYNQFIRSGKVGEGEKVISPTDKAFFYKQFNAKLGKFSIMNIYKERVPN